MINLTPYSENTIDFHDLVLTRKRIPKDDETYKERVAALRADIVVKFGEFDPLFASNDFSTIECHGFEGGDKGDLLKLYSYKSKTLQDLKVTVTTLENNRSLNTCQYCTLNEINSFDHYLPKDEFSEFVVNPKNLIPCCTNCNGRKGVIWRVNGLMQYLNLYQDELPNQQYLFVEILAPNDVIQPRFFLENRFGINGPLYDLLVSHYDRLDLCERFSANSNSIVIGLINLVISHRLHLDRNQIVDVVMEKTNRDRLGFGHNYWKPILEQELINSDLFMNGLFL